MRATIDRFRAARRDQSGFTLIELLIVIIILGVLAAVVVFSVRGITNNSEEAACKTEFRIVNTAIEAYYAENGTYDGDLAAAGTQKLALAALVDAGLLQSAPTEYVTDTTAVPAPPAEYEPVATGVTC